MSRNLRPGNSLHNYFSHTVLHNRKSLYFDMHPKKRSKIRTITCNQIAKVSNQYKRWVVFEKIPKPNKDLMRNFATQTPVENCPVHTTLKDRFCRSLLFHISSTWKSLLDFVFSQRLFYSCVFDVKMTRIVKKPTNSGDFASWNTSTRKFRPTVWASVTWTAPERVLVTASTFFLARQKSVKWTQLHERLDLKTT